MCPNIARTLKYRISLQCQHLLMKNCFHFSNVLDCVFSLTRLQLPSDWVSQLVSASALLLVMQYMIYIWGIKRFDEAAIRIWSKQNSRVQEVLFNDIFYFHNSRTIPIQVQTKAWQLLPLTFHISQHKIDTTLLRNSANLFHACVSIRVYC